MKKEEIKTWKEAEGWAVEVISQEKRKTRRWFIAWILTLAALIVSNLIWIFT